MLGVERVTITLPDDLVREIGRQEKNSSKFVAEAVRRELDRRRRVEFRRSLQNPHPERANLAEQGLENAETLVDSSVGTEVPWVQ